MKNPLLLELLIFISVNNSRNSRADRLLLRQVTLHIKCLKLQL